MSPLVNLRLQQPNTNQVLTSQASLLVSLPVSLLVSLLVGCIAIPTEILTPTGPKVADPAIGIGSGLAGPHVTRLMVNVLPRKPSAVSMEWHGVVCYEW